MKHDNDTRAPHHRGLKSPTKRTCDEATKCKRLSGFSQICRLKVDPYYDTRRPMNGAMIHDPSLANDLWDARVSQQPLKVR